MKIICIGLNYADHIAEMGWPRPDRPVFFIKPDTALIRNNEPFYIPQFSSEIHYECEVVVRINRVCKSLEERFAHRAWDQIGLGIDFTARDLQQRCKELGQPWEIAKAFDHSAAIAPQFIDKDEFFGAMGASDQRFDFSLSINNQIRQQGRAEDMIFGIDKIIAYVSQFVTLKIGDLIFTGTPSGVGAVAIGDTLRGELMGREMFNFQIK